MSAGSELPATRELLPANGLQPLMVAALNPQSTRGSCVLVLLLHNEDFLFCFIKGHSALTT